jgi:DNA-binding LacI/PurR family transcriptional regulator
VYLHREIDRIALQKASGCGSALYFSKNKDKENRMTKTISKRVLAMLLCILTLCTFIPATTAFAATQCTIDSTDVTDYFEYSNSSGWHDLNTPQHFVVESGAVAYCIQHKLGNPHSRGYSSFDPTANYSARTIRGIQIILENGYPCSTGGFTAAQARYATANAVRFWLSEEGADGQWNFTNRSAHPNSIRAKSGQQALLDWADSLLAKARSQALLTHSVSFTPSSLNMTVSGDYFVATTRVSLVNCSGGYQLDKSGLPSGTVVDGFTGRNGDTLTIKVPKQYGNQTIRLDAVGYDDRTTANLFWYAPNSGDYQKIITFTTGSYMPSTDAVLRMTTPAYGHIKIVKSDVETGNKLAGAVFGIYSNSSCTAEVARLTIGNNGTATSGDLMMGTYYVREISAPSPYLLDSTVHSVNVGASATVTVNATNAPAKGRITVTKTNADKSLGDYSLVGSVFDVYSGGAVITSITVDASGKGTSASIPLDDAYYYSFIHHAIEAELNSRGYQLFLVYINQNRPLPQLIKEIDPKGILLLGRVPQEFLREVKKLEIPTLSVGEYYRDLDVTVVIEDNIQGISRAMDHAVAKGYKSFGFVGAPHDDMSYFERWMAFNAYIGDHGLELKKEHVVLEPFNDISSVDHMAKTIAALGSLPQAFVCANDMIAVVLMNALAACGRKVPDDVGVIGFDNSEIAKMTYPRLTTVDIFMPFQGSLCVTTLIDMIEQETVMIRKIATMVSFVEGETLRQLSPGGV